MRIAAIATILATTALPAGALADDRDATGEKVAGTAAAPMRRTPFVPCLGRGYVPYSYPALDSCPCGSNACYQPWRYYCGGKTYKRQWFRTWLKAHFGKGSMLDTYPCEYRFPTVGRTWLSSQPVGPPAGSVPPAPSDPRKTNSEGNDQ